MPGSNNIIQGYLRRLRQQLQEDDLFQLEAVGLKMMDIFQGTSTQNIF